MQEFIDIFAQMGVASIILLVFGALLLVAECLTPGFNVAGFSGMICLCLGIVARIVEGATLTQTLLLILIVAIVVGVLFGLFIKSAKSGVLSKTSIIETGTAVPQNYGEPVNKYLLGKTGVAKTFCKPVGKVVIDEQVYEAITSYGYIEAGKTVVVEKVDHDYLYIRQIEEKSLAKDNDVVVVSENQINVDDIILQNQKATDDLQKQNETMKEMTGIDDSKKEFKTVKEQKTTKTTAKNAKKAEN